jgi:hypothetical protein
MKDEETNLNFQSQYNDCSINSLVEIKERVEREVRERMCVYILSRVNKIPIHKIWYHQE